MNTQDAIKRLVPSCEKDYVTMQIQGELVACRLLNIDHNHLTVNQVLSDGRILSVQTTMIPFKRLMVYAESINVGD